MNNKKKQLHSGARWLFRLTGFFLVFFLAIFLSGFIFPISIILFSFLFKNATMAVIIAILAFFGFIAFVIVLTEVYARMSYNRWFYEFDPSNLKIERGIIWKRYSNVPYERVQNVDIRRGIIARTFGFSSVFIQTAGFSYSPRGGGIGAEGYLPAVSMKEAEDIREFLMKKISKNSKQGL